jgi:hypothetical protein
LVIQGQTDADKGKSKFGSMLNDDLIEILKRVSAVLNILESSINKPMKESDGKKVAKELPIIDKMFEESVQMAKNFGYDAGAKGKKRKKSSV